MASVFRLFLFLFCLTSGVGGKETDVPGVFGDVDFHLVHGSVGVVDGHVAE